MSPGWRTRSAPAGWFESILGDGIQSIPGGQVEGGIGGGFDRNTQGDTSLRLAHFQFSILENRCDLSLWFGAAQGLIRH